MKLIKPSWKILEQEPGINGIYKAIERAGRTCYKSEDKITEDSAKGFVDRMIKSGHGSMLEHGTVYLLYSANCYSRSDLEFINKYISNPYSKVICMGSDDDLVEQTDKNIYSGDIWGTGVYGNTVYAITTNYRALIENNWLNDLEYLCEPTEYHVKRITVRFVCDRGVSHEFVRHRVFSFAQESTRYCNYSSNKFNNELTFIMPPQFPESTWQQQEAFMQVCKASEDYYIALLGKWDDRKEDKRFKTGFKDNPWKPQEARAVLPNSLKTELVMTGFVSDWKHFFELRCAPNAHPSARELAIPLSEEFVKKGLV